MVVIGTVINVYVQTYTLLLKVHLSLKLDSLKAQVLDLILSPLSNTKLKVCLVADQVTCVQTRVVKKNKSLKEKL